jgi:hypothetical protein
MRKENHVAKDAPIKTVSGANPEEMIDVEIVRIAKEKYSVSNGFDDTDAIRNGAFDDVDEKERECRCDFGVCCRVV